MADLATLSIKVDASGAVTVLDGLGNKLGQTGKQADKLGGTIATLGAVFAGFQAAKFAQDTLNLGARYETLGVVMNVVGRNAGKTRAEMDGFQASLQKTGISMIGARESLAQMAGAQLDLAKASGLARVAQNAAVIANINSSEAFGRLISGITTGQPEVLRTLGIFVDMKAGQEAYAESLGKSADNLTAAEKTQANMNTAMQGGVAIAGSYEAAMGTAGKQLLSTVRYMEDARVKASEAFQPAYTQAVFAYAEALKAVANNANTVAAALVGVAAAIGAIVLALSAAKATAFFKAMSVEAVAFLGIMVLVAQVVNIFASNYIEQIKKATAEQKRFNDEVANMKAPELKNLITEGQSKLLAMSLQGFGQGGKIAKEYAELEARVIAYKLALAQLGIVAGETGAAHTSAMDELKKSKQEDAKATQLEIDYAKKYWVEISKLILKKEELKKINEEIAARTLTTELPKIDMGDLGLPDPGKYVTEWLRLQEIAQQSRESLAKTAREYEEQERASLAETRKRMAEEEKKQLKEVADIRENFVKQFQQTFATGIANMLENGLAGWRSFFGSVTSMLVKLVADFASAKITTSVMGSIFPKEGGVGASLAAVNPLAPILLMLTASMTAVMDIAKQAADAAIRFGAASKQWKSGFDEFIASFSYTNAQSAAAALAASFTQFANTAITQALELIKNSPAAMFGSISGGASTLTLGPKKGTNFGALGSMADIDAYIASLKGAQGTGKNVAEDRALAVLLAQLEKVREAYVKQAAAASQAAADLEATTKALAAIAEAARLAAEEFEASLTAMDLDARRLAATGFDEQSAATTLFTRQAREYAQAVKDGWSIAQLINLQEVQALERLKDAAKKASTEIIYSANSLAAMTDQVVEVSAAWQKTIDGLSEARNAAEQTANAIRKTVDATRTLFDTLSGYMKSLLVGTLSPLTKSQQVAEARSQFEDAARKAAFGDLEAGSKVTGLANTFLQLMKDTSQASAEAARALVPKYFRDQMAAPDGTQTAEYQQAFADVAAMIDAATLGVGGQLDIQVQQLRQAELQTAILGRMLAQANAAARGLPFFAHGGDHSGGVAMVGERGPELINIGRARIFSAADSAAAFAGNSTATVDELRRVIARLETLVRVTAAGAELTVKAVARVGNDVANLTREVRLSGEAAA